MLRPTILSPSMTTTLSPSTKLSHRPSASAMPPAELAAVAEQRQELAGMVAAGDDHDLVDPGRDECLDGKEDHRLVIHRQQMLVGDPRERMKSRAGAPGQNDAFHSRFAPSTGIACHRP